MHMFSENPKEEEETESTGFEKMVRRSVHLWILRRSSAVEVYKCK